MLYGTNQYKDWKSLLCTHREFCCFKWYKDNDKLGEDEAEDMEGDVVKTWVSLKYFNLAIMI